MPPHLPPDGVLRTAMDEYKASHPHDKRAHLIDLGPAAATHLTGFRFTPSGRFDMTAESADGIHPTIKRHGELGDMLYAEMRKLLADDVGDGSADYHFL